MKTKLFLVLYVTLLAMVQGAWAQTEVSSESALNEALNSESPISIKLTAAPSRPTSKTATPTNRPAHQSGRRSHAGENQIIQ